MANRFDRDSLIHAINDPEALQMIVDMLNSQLVAQDILREKGYGVTGTPLIQTVMEVPVNG